MDVINSHNLIYLRCTTLRNISNARVEKILCDELSVNMVAMPVFGTYFGHVHSSSRKQDYFAINKKENKSPLVIIFEN